MIIIKYVIILYKSPCCETHALWGKLKIIWPALPASYLHLFAGQTMPLFVIMIGKTYAVPPLLQATPLARSTEDERAQEVVALANILVPHRQHERLLVQVVGTCLEQKLLVEDGVQVAPLDVRPELPLVPIRFQVTIQTTRRRDGKRK